MGKIAVFSILAGLAAVAGLVFSGSDTEAQSYGGYTYSQQVCQECGQQPRWYNVRDGQAAYNGGNSDSGWLIVLVRGATFVAAEYTITNSAGVHNRGNVTNALADAQNELIPPHGSLADPNAPVGSRITATDGTSGFVTNNGRRVVIDRNNNGELDAGDIYVNAGWYGYDRARYTEVRAPSNYGTQYIRWAHMAWCH